MLSPALKFIFCASLAFWCLSVSAQGFTFAAIGDMPYGSRKKMERLIEQINSEEPSFTIHVGDIKSGSSPCSDDAYLQVKQLFNRFNTALVYTPGDNEWTDCHRASNGSMDPIERLEKIRSMFFDSAYSLGQHPFPLQSQSSIAGFEKFAENRLWHFQGITFGTLHLVGSNNNLQANAGAAAEFMVRDQANRAWMSFIFNEARIKQSAAVVLAMQADTWHGENQYIGTGYLPWIETLETEVKTWGKPILLIQGDSHEFKVNQPFIGSDRKRIDNVTRLVVHGDHNVHATLVTVRPFQQNQPFSFRILMNDSR